MCVCADFYTPKHTHPPTHTHAMGYLTTSPKPSTPSVSLALSCSRSSSHLNAPFLAVWRHKKTPSPDYIYTFPVGTFRVAPIHRPDIMSCERVTHSQWPLKVDSQELSGNSHWQQTVYAFSENFQTFYCTLTPTIVMHISLYQMYCGLTRHSS